MGTLSRWDPDGPGGPGWTDEPLPAPDAGGVTVRMPGSAVLVDYASQCERDRSVRLAEERQANRRARLRGALVERAGRPRPGDRCA